MIESLDPVSLDDLASLESAETLVLTVNNRYARHIISELSTRLDTTRRVMALPGIVPVSAWLREVGSTLLFEAGAQLPAHVVDSFGAQLLWQDAIAAVESDEALLDVAQAAKLAMDADWLMSEWRLVISPQVETADYRRFMLWRERYHAMLNELDADDANQAMERLVDAMTKGRLRLPYTTVILAGFNEFSPRFCEVLAGMRLQGVRLCALHTPRIPADSLVRVAAPDPDAEWRLAAQWAADRLRMDPQGRYAIIAARLEADVVFAHRALRQALADAAGSVLPYNIAVARPLAEWPLVRAAIAWLRVLSDFSGSGFCEPERAGAALLAGGCLAHDAESDGRARIDASWRKQGLLRVSHAEFAKRLAQMAPRLARAWNACLASAAEQQGAVDVDVWTSRFRHFLQLLAYPGRVKLDSHSYQSLEAFEALFSRLARQAHVLGPLRMSGAVALLRRLARETPFQPQRDPDSRLDVLGFLESEGGRWDGIWVLGLTDEILPAAARPNPLVPLAALRLANAPRATPERELQWAGAMYEALLCCAPEVRLSHALFEGERELRPSPYIAGLPRVEQIPARKELLVRRIEQLSDDKGPALRAGAVTRGGIGVIDTQSRNPLWAFVKYRLGASEMLDYADSADQNARGRFLHRAVELVWRLLPGQQALQQVRDAGDLDQLVRQSVEQAAAEHLGVCGATVKALEIERAAGVLDEWLSRELERRPFSVLELEREFTWKFDTLELALRVDRIDQLEDRRLAVIDYKTGSGRIDPKPDWMRERPVNLQLPFYCAVLAGREPAVAALLLARLHARKVEVRGLADGDHGLRGADSLRDWRDFAHMSWDQLVSRWRQTIEQLAGEFAQGIAVNESLRPDDLQYCDVRPFLRLDEEARDAQ